MYGFVAESVSCRASPVCQRSQSWKVAGKHFLLEMMGPMWVFHSFTYMALDSERINTTNKFTDRAGRCHVQSDVRPMEPVVNIAHNRL